MKASKKTILDMNNFGREIEKKLLEQIQKTRKGEAYFSQQVDNKEIAKLLNDEIEKYFAKAGLKISIKIKDDGKVEYTDQWRGLHAAIKKITGFREDIAAAILHKTLDSIEKMNADVQKLCLAMNDGLNRADFKYMREYIEKDHLNNKTKNAVKDVVFSVVAVVGAIAAVLAVIAFTLLAFASPAAIAAATAVGVTTGVAMGASGATAAVGVLVTALGIKGFKYDEKNLDKTIVSAITSKLSQSLETCEFASKSATKFLKEGVSKSV